MDSEEFINNIRANMAAMQASKPAMQSAWEQVLADDAIWEQRAQRYGKLRTWWLRWQLRK